MRVTFVSVVVAISLPLAGALAFGLSRFVRAPGIPVLEPPAQEDEPAEEHNLAWFRYGPRVRVSSYHRDPLSQHHPMFLIDGVTAPILVEKWVSAIGDSSPWVEITWRRPRQLERVVLRHAGEYESRGLTLANYTLTCLHASGPGKTIVVKNNVAGLAVHPLGCADATGVRLDTDPGVGSVRLYEMEAWGK